MPVVNKEAAEFAKRWKGKGDEKQDSQNFWRDLLSSVFNVAHPEQKLCFEKSVSLKNTSFMDVYIPETRVIIEQKSLGIDLEKAKKQSDGSELTPFGQAKRYNDELALSEKARWIVTCNFERFLIYDMEKPKEPPTELLLKNMAKEYHLLDFLVKFKNEALIREEELSIKAGEIVGQIYDALLKEYGDNPTPQDYKSLNKLCVRLVFCLYAEDAGLFGDSGDAFCKYLEKYQASDLRREIIDLFKILDTPFEKRNKFLQKDLAQFPYVNGSLFSVDEDLENIPNFSEELRDILIKQAAEGFDWSDISPTIFGAVFESTLNPETRRSGGMHYTSIENIHKVIDPLFLDELNNEFKTILETKQSKSKKAKLEAFQRKLASLTFLDPACGSGNFLTETYLALRKLENQILDELYHGSTFLGSDFVVSSPIQVSIGQFYGIEINDFAVSVAKTALWIAESQTIIETEQILNTHIDFFPLKSYSNIIEANALRIDWNSLIPTEKLNYIMGNPPFVGYDWLNPEQQKDMSSFFSKTGRLDYVTAWYVKSAQYINKNTHCAFVSTNSITQGVQVPSLWNELNKFNITIDFAYRTFIWNSEAAEKAQVHCVIIGFSKSNAAEKYIFNENNKRKAKNINPYLVDGEDIIVQQRTEPFKGVPKMVLGNMPKDGGGFILNEDEYNYIKQNDPVSVKYIKRYMMGKEFINNIPRYCFWFYNEDISDLDKAKSALAHLKKVKQYRESSTAESTRKLAIDKPLLFAQISQPLNKSFLAVPKVSSSNRKYIPIGYLDSSIIVGDKLFIIPDGDLYTFSVLTSIVHNAWMRTVAGRLKSDYSYTTTVVYNTFPWIEVNEKDKRNLENLAKNILSIRDKYLEKGKSLADLYGDKLELIYSDLNKAHKANDKAVMALYGFSADASEEEIVAKLMQMYSDKVKELQKSAK